MTQITKTQEIEETEVWKIFKDSRGKGPRGALWEFSTLGNVRQNGEHYEPTIHIFNGMPRRVACGCLVYRVVAELFISNPDWKKTVDHVDRNSLNDRVDNLRWCTMKEQCQNRKDKEFIFSEDVRRKMSESHKGRHHSEETRRKTSESEKETRRKMREAWAKRKSQA